MTRVGEKSRTSFPPLSTVPGSRTGGSRGSCQSKLPVLNLKDKLYRRSSQPSGLLDASQVLQRSSQGRSLRGQMGVLLAEIGAPVSPLAPRSSQQRKMNDSSKSFSRRDVTLEHQLKRPKSRLDLEIQRLRNETQSTPIPESTEEASDGGAIMPPPDSRPSSSAKVAFAPDVVDLEPVHSKSDHSPSPTRTSHLAVVYSLPHQHRRQSLLEVRAAHLAELISNVGSQRREGGRREKVKGRRDTIDFSIDRRISDSSTTLASGQTKLTLALFGEHGVVAQELEQMRRSSSQEEPSDAVARNEVGFPSSSPDRRTEGELHPPPAAKRSSTAPLNASGYSKAAANPPPSSSPSPTPRLKPFSEVNLQRRNMKGSKAS